MRAEARTPRKSRLVHLRRRFMALNYKQMCDESVEAVNGRSEFPEGMRVLAVDDNKVCLTILAALLKKCQYQVTEMTSKTEALALLRQNVNKYDIVLTNVNIDEMDGFKLLEAGLELDIPVIMISASENRDIIMKGVRHGAVNYLLKPVSLEALQTIWQHVYRKQLPNLLSSTKDQGRVSNNDPGEGMVRGDVETSRVARRSSTKRKSCSGEDGDPEDDSDRGGKRDRIKWTKELHDKFLDAVDRLNGVDNAVPKKILELMGEPDITREKVASHLQKYRKLIKTVKGGQSSNQINNNNQFPFPCNAFDPSISVIPTTNHQLHATNMYQDLSMVPNYQPQWPAVQPIAYQQPLPAMVNPRFTQQPRTMAPFPGNFISTTPNFYLEQPQQLTFGSRPQAPEELLVSGPLDPLCDAHPLNVMLDDCTGYSDSGYNSLFDNP